MIDKNGTSCRMIKYDKRNLEVEGTTNAKCFYLTIVQSANPREDIKKYKQEVDKLSL